MAGVVAGLPEPKLNPTAFPRPPKLGVVAVKLDVGAGKLEVVAGGPKFSLVGEDAVVDVVFEPKRADLPKGDAGLAVLPNADVAVVAPNREDGFAVPSDDVVVIGVSVKGRLGGFEPKLNADFAPSAGGPNENADVEVGGGLGGLDG